MKSIFKLPALLLISLLTLFSTVAFAEENAGKEGHVSETKSEGMSEEERKEKRKMIRKHNKKKHVRRMAELDTNKDGRADLSEYLAHAEKRFNELDADGDGFVTKEEARNRHRELRKKHKEMRKKMQRENEVEKEAESES